MALTSFRDNGLATNAVDSRPRVCNMFLYQPGLSLYISCRTRPGSLAANGDCPDARRVVFAVDADGPCRRVIDRHGALLVECTRLANVNPTVKSVMYTAARVLAAESFVCLDADMLVFGSLEPVFAAIDASPARALLACREGSGRCFEHLEHAVLSLYGGRPGDLRKITGADGGEGAYPLVVNDGIFAGGRAALLALDALLRRWTGAPGWIDERGDVWWRNQAVFNLAMAHLRCGVELDPTFNVQLNTEEVEMACEGGRVAARWRGRPVRVLHFNGRGRHLYPEWSGLFASGGSGG
jgi:hypothetical protein